MARQARFGCVDMAKNILIVALAWFAGFLVLGSLFGAAGGRMVGPCGDR